MIKIDDKPIFTDYIKLENQSQFLVKVPLLHPDDPRYAVFWSKQFKNCIEGVWGEMFDGYRYMPGKLYFYKNYFLIQDTDANKQTRYVRPRTDDIEWELAYMSLEAHGFSGFINSEFTSLELANTMPEPTDLIKERYPEAVDGNKFKPYIPPRENMRKVHTEQQGRALMQTKMRYITARRDKKTSIVYGLERHDNTKRTYIVEGPIDSLFLPNCIAVASSDLVSVTKRMTKIREPIFCFDNEPRNKEIVKLMLKAIEAEYSLCIWPDRLKEKDINEMILSGMTSDEIKTIIDENICSGVTAEINLAEWRKC